jgi:hypothetical protein
VFRNDEVGNHSFDNTKSLVNLLPNQYFMYLPSISPLDFEHRGLYQIQVTYGEHTETFWFGVLNPNVYYADPEYCENAQEKIIKEKTSLNSIQHQIDKIISENNEILTISQKALETEKLEKQEFIKNLEQCKII